VRRELLAGLTTFMTMAYVVIVNPQILAESGMPVDGVLFATCISSAVATLVMDSGRITRLPSLLECR
jgi:AGZA family xanthine/uracil permease-like MFS transporter